MKFIIISSLFLIFSINFISAEDFGYDNPSAPSLDSPTTTFNNNTANVNSSQFWDTTNQGPLSSTAQIDHDLLNNLEWSVAGHTIDTTFDFGSNNAIGLTDLNMSGDVLTSSFFEVYPNAQTTVGLRVFNSGGDIALSSIAGTNLKVNDNLEMSGDIISNGDKVWNIGDEGTQFNATYSFDFWLNNTLDSCLHFGLSNNHLCSGGSVFGDSYWTSTFRSFRISALFTNSQLVNRIHASSVIGNGYILEDGAGVDIFNVAGNGYAVFDSKTGNFTIKSEDVPNYNALTLANRDTALNFNNVSLKFDVLGGFGGTEQLSALTIKAGLRDIVDTVEDSQVVFSSFSGGSIVDWLGYDGNINTIGLFMKAGSRKLDMQFADSSSLFHRYPTIRVGNTQTTTRSWAKYELQAATVNGTWLADGLGNHTFTGNTPSIAFYTESVHPIFFGTDNTKALDINETTQDVKIYNNLTLSSPNGTNFTCQVNNTGSIICT